MKAKYIIKACLSLLLVPGFLFFASCSKQDSSFNVSGDCLIEALELDNEFVGTIDHAARTVVVAVPEVHEDQLMTITRLDLSAGATANYKAGDKVNLNTPVVLHVVNGNVFQDYKLTVKHDEARILSFVLNDEYIGIIDQEAHTISVSVPIGTDVRHSFRPLRPLRGRPSLRLPAYRATLPILWSSRWIITLLRLLIPLPSKRKPIR